MGFLADPGTSNGGPQGLDAMSATAKLCSTMLWWHGCESQETAGASCGASATMPSVTKGIGQSAQWAHKAPSATSHAGR